MIDETQPIVLPETWLSWDQSLSFQLWNDHLGIFQKYDQDRKDGNQAEIRRKVNIQKQYSMLKAIFIAEIMLKKPLAHIKS